jgi:hypothetical protein
MCKVVESFDSSNINGVPWGEIFPNSLNLGIAATVPARLIEREPIF